MTGSAPRPWSAPTVEGGVRGTVTVPSSKSATARSLVLAALADAPSTQRGVLSSRDTDLMVAALRGLGVRIEDAGADALRVTPPERFTPGDVHVGLAGTVMRFLPAVAALADGESRFTGDAAASARPNGPLLAGLAQLGVDVDRMEREGRAARDGRPVVALSRTDPASVAAVREWVLETLVAYRGGGHVAVDPGPMAPHSHGPAHAHGDAHAPGDEHVHQRGDGTVQAQVSTTSHTSVGDHVHVH